MTDPIVHRHAEVSSAAQRAHERMEAHTREVISLVGQWHDDITPAELRQAARTISRFRYELLCHFAWEEHEGYMRPVVEADPTRAAAVQELHCDHQRLRAAVDHALDNAIAGGYGAEVNGTAVRDLLLGLVKDLQEHEAKESQIVQEVFYRDVGTKD